MVRRVAEKSVHLIRRGLNKTFWTYAGRDQRPVFFDVGTTFPALLEIDRNYDAIKAELDGILDGKAESLQRYHDIDPTQRPISKTDADASGAEVAWKVFFLYALGEPLSNSHLCPKTSEIVSKIPGVYQAFFSILDPGRSIPAHSGPYIGILRHHTAFRVPANNPPSIRVKDEVYTWKERESVLFDDSWDHEVYNESDGMRVVLIVDVLRPMPWLPNLLNVVACRTLVKMLYAKKVAGRVQKIDL